VQGGIPAVLIYEDLEFLTPFMHSADDDVGTSLNSPADLEANARLGAASIAILAGPLEGPPPIRQFRRGDANADGANDVSDAVAILFHLFAAEDFLCEQAGDVNDDGLLDISDAIYLLCFLFTDGRPIEPPAEACGVDPTGHSLRCESFSACP
jgi:hypothetical protein